MPRVSLNQKAPDFSLADLRGVKNVLLVFNRTFT